MHTVVNSNEAPIMNEVVNIVIQMLQTLLFKSPWNAPTPNPSTTYILPQEFIYYALLLLGLGIFTHEIIRGTPQQ